jgi:APA family basic amino acid/polyamine antiporter
MKRSMGPVYLFAMAAATIIGPWLVMTNWWISLTGASIALAFVLVGLMCVPIGLVYGELTAAYPKAGGSFVYLRRAFGKETSYWVSWALMLSYAAVLAFQLMALMDIIRFLWWPDMTIEIMMVLAAAVAALNFLLNTREVNIGAGVQFLLFLILAVIGFGYSLLFFTNGNFSTGNWDPLFMTGTDGFLTATALMVTMFFGFEVIPQFAEEAKYPLKKMWKLITASILFAAAFYGIICLAEAGMGPFDQIIDTSMLGAQLALDNYGSWLMYLIALANVAALATCLIGFWMGSSRLLMAMGRENVLPRSFASLNKNGVPKTANLIILLVVLVLILMTGTDWLTSLFTLIAAGVGITYTGVVLAFFKLRRSDANVERPYKIHGGMAMGVLALVCGLLIAYFTFAYFTLDVWILFGVYYSLVAAIRVFMYFDDKSKDKVSVE